LEIATHPLVDTFNFDAEKSFLPQESSDEIASLEETIASSMSNLELQAIKRLEQGQATVFPAQTALLNNIFILSHTLLVVSSDRVTDSGRGRESPLHVLRVVAVAGTLNSERNTTTRKTKKTSNMLASPRYCYLIVPIAY
jgi:hypothetical protein